MTKIEQLKITAALLIKSTSGFSILRKLRKNDNQAFSQEIAYFYKKLINELFWFLPSKTFWPSYLSLKEKILSYFDDFPNEYSRMIEIPEEFLMLNLENSKSPKIRSPDSNPEDSNHEDNLEETEDIDEDHDMVEPEEKEDIYDVIPLITPDGKVIRVVVKFEKDESRESTQEKTRKLVESIESGKLSYKCLPKEQVILYDNEEDNQKAMKLLRVDRQSKDERQFTETTFKLKSSLSGKIEKLDFKTVCGYFEDLKLIKYSSTLLLKHSNCVLVIKNLREFDVKKSKKNKSLETKLSHIRLECKKLYIYYKSFFTFLPGLRNFWKEYVDCKSKFDDILSNMSKDERICVTELPLELLDEYDK